MGDNERYRESDDHVPSPTDMVEQIDTTGLGGPNSPRQVSDVFAVAADREAVEASQALRDGDQSRVILPDDPAEREAAEAALHKRADDLRRDGVSTSTEVQEDALRRGAGPAGGTPQPADPDDEVQATARRRRSGSRGS